MSDATMKTEEDNATIRLIISFKGKKLKIPLIPGTSVGCVKSKLLLTASSDENTTLKKMTTGDVKLLHKGKVLKEVLQIQSLNHLIVLLAMKCLSTHS